MFVARACYDPEKAAKVWKHLNNNDSGKKLEIFSTHPANETRYMYMCMHKYTYLFCRDKYSVMTTVFIMSFPYLLPSLHFPLLFPSLLHSLSLFPTFSIPTFLSPSYVLLSLSDWRIWMCYCLRPTLSGRGVTVMQKWGKGFWVSKRWLKTNLRKCLFCSMF